MKELWVEKYRPNTVAIGDKITLVTTSNSALTNLQASLKTTRI